MEQNIHQLTDEAKRAALRGRCGRINASSLENTYNNSNIVLTNPDRPITCSEPSASHALKTITYQSSPADPVVAGLGHVRMHWKMPIQSRIRDRLPQDKLSERVPQQGGRQVVLDLIQIIDSFREPRPLPQPAGFSFLAFHPCFQGLSLNHNPYIHMNFHPSTTRA